MSVELGKFLSQQLESLPVNHSDRPFIEGLSMMVDTYVVNTEAVPTRKMPTIGEMDLFAKSLPLNLKARKFAGRLYRVGEITSGDDLRHITDIDLLRYPSIGPKIVSNIREHFPYSPREDK